MDTSRLPRRLPLPALLLLLVLAVSLAAQQAAAEEDEDGPSGEGKVEGPKQDQDGTYLTQAYKQAVLDYSRSLERDRTAARAQAQTSQSQQPGWVQIGPAAARWQAQGGRTQNSGRVKTILQDPTNLNRVYVGFSAGGVWRTDDFFSKRPTWRALTDSPFASVPTTSVGAMALGAADPKRMYLGLGDLHDIQPTLGGVVCTSKDVSAVKGAMFAADDCVVLEDQTAIRDIKVAPKAGLGGMDQVIVAASAGRYINTNEQKGGMFVSRNAGKTFSPARLGGNCYSIAQTSIGWLATCLVEGRSEIWRSSDNGSTWSRSSAYPFGGVADEPVAGRATLAAHKPGSNIVYALVAEADGGRFLDIFRSNNGGAGNSWIPLQFLSKPVNNAPSKEALNTTEDDIVGGSYWGPISQANYNQMLLVDPSDSTGNTFFFGANLITAKSTDGGASFNVTSWWLNELADYGIPYVHADHHTAAYLLRPPAQLQANGDQAVSMNDLGLPLTGSGYGGSSTGIEQDPAAIAAAAENGEGAVQAAVDAPGGAGGVSTAADAAGRVLVFGTDGGIFVSGDGESGAMDSGEKNSGISTMLVDIMAATPLFPDLVAVGTQDNAVRSRVGASPSWNAVSGGDGTGIVMSQAGRPARGCVLGQTNWNGCPWRYNMTVLATNTNEVLSDNIEAEGAECGSGSVAITNKDSDPNRAAGFVVPPTDKTGQVFYMKFARNIFKTKDCGNTWTAWAGVSRGKGLPRPTKQDSGDDDPCLDAVCDNNGSAVWAGWADASGSVTLAIHPLNFNKAASLLFVSHKRDKPGTPAIALTADDGQNWVTQSFGVRRWFPRSTTSPTFSADGKRLFVGYSRVGANWPARILVKEDPFGAAAGVWKPLPAAGLPLHVPILRMLAHPVRPKTLFVANWLGVYATYDGGLTFVRLGDKTDQPMPLVQASDLSIISRRRGGFKLRAGTRGRSVFEYNPVV